MKGNSVLFGMAFLLAAFSVGITLLSYQWVQLTRDLNQAQSMIAMVESRQARLRVLISEAVEYSQQNPSINPILYAVGVKQAAGSSPLAAPPAPAAPVVGKKPQR